MTLARNAIFSASQVLIGAAIIFFLYRFINDTLGPAALGIWSVVLAAASATRLADLGVSASATRFVAAYIARGDQKTAAQVVEIAATSSFLMLAVALSLLYYPLDLVLSLIFDSNHLLEAQAVLPYAMVSLFIGGVAVVFQSSLDGCQRMDLRVALVLTSQVAMVLLAVVLVPKFGLVGLALAQIGQGALLLILGWWLIVKRFFSLRFNPMNWSPGLFREMFGYGANLQVASLSMLLIDPLTKALLAKYGGPAIAGYFEIANQVVLRVRSLIVAANQAIVPKIAELSEVYPERLGVFYRQNIRILMYTAFPIFSLLFACSEGFSLLVVGSVSPDLVLLIKLSTLFWLTNLFAGPAYFINQGTGAVRWNTLSHVCMGVTNGICGWALGSSIGAEGVVLAYGSAVIIGSIALVVVFQRRSGIRLRQLALQEHTWIIASSLSVCVVAHYFWRAGPSETPNWLAFGGIVSLALALAMWKHPLRREIYFLRRR
jgi:O-antigen/teichoic acid export membrane protein